MPECKLQRGERRRVFLAGPADVGRRAEKSRTPSMVPQKAARDPRPLSSTRLRRQPGTAERDDRDYGDGRLRGARRASHPPRGDVGIRSARSTALFARLSAGRRNGSGAGHARAELPRQPHRPSRSGDTAPGHLVRRRAWMSRSPRGAQQKRRAASMPTRWPIERMLARGYAVATFFYGDLFPDRADGRALSIQPHLRQRQQARRYIWGAIATWAWGMSRALDALQAMPDIDARRVALIGHSRHGKAALWAGALDERFALVIANNSGKGGASLMRRNFGETIRHLVTRYPHWFAPRYAHYAGPRSGAAGRPAHADRADRAAARSISPRRRGRSLGRSEGRVSGARSLPSPSTGCSAPTGSRQTTMPAPEEPVMSTIGYHIRRGGHGVTAVGLGAVPRFRRPPHACMNADGRCLRMPISRRRRAMPPRSAPRRRQRRPLAARPTPRGALRRRRPADAGRDGPVLLPRQGRRTSSRTNIPAAREFAARYRGQAPGADDRLRAGRLVVSVRQPARRPLRLLVPADARSNAGRARRSRQRTAQAARFRFATCGGAILQRERRGGRLALRATSAISRRRSKSMSPLARGRERSRGLVRRSLRARRALLFRAVAPARATA